MGWNITRKYTERQRFPTNPPQAEVLERKKDGEEPARRGHSERKPTLISLWPHVSRWREATSSPSWVQVRDGPAACSKEAVVAWLLLVIAGLFEVLWAFTMKQSEGFTRLWPSVITLIAMLVSFGLLSWSMRVLPLGTAYTVWTGIGAVGAFILGILVLGEAASFLRILAAVLIVSGLLLMKLSSPD
jgi:quaternary ammonium compound-resistance protein SugE